MPVHKISTVIGNKTFSPRYDDFRLRGPLAPEWLIVDAKDQVLGRTASQVAILLRGKHKPYFSPHLNLGDYVVVINTSLIRLSGNKLRDKVYYRHTGYPGGLKSISAQHLHKDKPTEMLRLAIKRMLPKNIIGRNIIHARLKLYPEETHPHIAQNPRPWLLIGQTHPTTDPA